LKASCECFRFEPHSSFPSPCETDTSRPHSSPPSHSADEDGHIRVWSRPGARRGGYQDDTGDDDDDTPLLDIRAHSSAVNHLAFSPRDPATLASVSDDGSARIWDLQRPPCASPQTLTFPDGTVAGPCPNAVRVL
jgi:WD40 repeat protein